MGQNKIIKDTINEVFLQNDILQESAPLPEWGADTTAFLYGNTQVDVVIARLNGTAGQYIGTNPPPH